MATRITETLTPDKSRKVVCLIIEPNETKPERTPLPKIQTVALSADARRSVVEALGFGDSGSLLIGDLAEEFAGLPIGSACGMFHGGEGFHVRIIGPKVEGSVIELPANVRVMNSDQDARAAGLAPLASVHDAREGAAAERHAVDVLSEENTTLALRVSQQAEEIEVLSARVAERDARIAELEEKLTAPSVAPNDA